MKENVKNWKHAKAEGFDTSLYHYEGSDFPSGEVEAILLTKIWAKKAYTINCYFQSIRNGMRFCLSVYRRHNDHLYSPGECSTDFRTCPAPAIYRLRIVDEDENKIRLVHAEPVNV